MFSNISVLNAIIFDVVPFVQLLLTFYLSFLALLIWYFLLTQSNCVVLNLNSLAHIFLLILFFIKRRTDFQKHFFTALYFAKS